MLNLLNAVIAYCQTNFPDFVGSYFSGNTKMVGPFLNFVPEPAGIVASEADYMTIQTFGIPSDLGFISSTGTTTYVEQPRIRFMTWSVDPDAALGNMEIFTANMDALGTLPLAGGEQCYASLREQVAQNIPQPKSKNGGQMWCFYCDYLFRNVRTVGVV